MATKLNNPKDFFHEIAVRAQSLQYASLFLNQAERTEVVRIAVALQGQYRRPDEKRSLYHIQASYHVLEPILVRTGLMKEYRGDKKLIRDLLYFLETGKRL